MKLLESIRDRVLGGIAGLTLGGRELTLGLTMAQESVIDRQRDIAHSAFDGIIKEGLAEIELAMEDVSWRDMSSPNGAWNFSRAALLKMVALARIMYLVNPLIKRAVTVQELYVWGSGCTVKADSDAVNEVVHDFLDDPKNQCVIGESWMERERNQRLDGNTYFVLFRNKMNGAARIRLLPTESVEDIITDPNDSKDPWFYKRNSPSGLDPITGEPFGGGGPCLFPDVDYNPIRKPAQAADGTPIDWDVRVMHLKTGGLPGMKIGVPELYSALNWATAYKKILENFATILAAYARVAMQIKNLPGKAGTAAAKSRLNTGLSTSNGVDNNPPTNTASNFLSSGNVEISAIKTAHSTTAPDEARALRSMVAAGTDTPEHFFGDSDIGNFATSTTLDRPTELKMVARQDMWTHVIKHMARVLITWSAVAPQGKLRLAGFKAQPTRDPFDGTILTKVIPPDTETLNVTVTFPPIVDREIVERVRAVVQAATLNGSKAEGIFPDRKLLCKLLLEALGRKDVDKLVDAMYPNEVTQGFIDPKATADNEKIAADAKKLQAEALMKSAEMGGQKPATTSNQD